MKTRVAIVDEHVALRQMLAHVLGSEKKYEVVVEAQDGRVALDALKRLKPDIAILELALPGLCGKEVLRRTRLEVPGTRVLVFSGTLNQTLALDALRSNPHGFVHKRDSLGTFLEALRAVAAGRSYYSDFASGLLSNSFGGVSYQLTSREMEILQLVAESCSSKEIAARLGLAPKTVENHRAHIMDKLHVHDTAALTRYALRNGLVT
jgi:DNA-binding NarL/FixJ family response regulator